MTTPADGTNPVRPGQEHLDKLRAQVDAAEAMGISDRDMINHMILQVPAEEIFAQVQDVLTSHQKHVTGLMKRLQSILSDLQDLVDAPFTLAGMHLETQKALLKRLAKLSEEAEPQDVAMLAAAYSALPPPYSQRFYWPPEEEGQVFGVADELPDG